ncbi:hypothetical protein GCM10010232_27770 [Streptomyces amakusaensis]|uniref:Lipoprotein n=1 Tax=Streptomyces amakusaensis TaxID=67271 RepID=A0ABW0AJA1_9ACTN
MSVTHRRRLAPAAGAVFLALTLAGCSGLGRTAPGTYSYDTPGHRHVLESNPLVTGCHKLGEDGALKLENNTLVDMQMYPTEDCSGESSAYIATTTSNVVAPGAVPWRAFSLIH